MPEVPEQSVIEFPDGIPGLDASRRFVIASPHDCEPVLLLQSVDDDSVSLPAVPVQAVDPDYRLRLSAEDQQILGLGENPVPGKEALCLSVLILPGTGRPPLCNLQAPLVINPVTRVGRQVVQADSDYPSCFPIGGE